MMTSLTLNCNNTDPLLRWTCLLVVMLFMSHCSAPKLQVLETKPMWLDTIRLHKTARQLEALSGQQLPPRDGKTQQLNLKGGWGSESCCDLLCPALPWEQSLAHGSHHQGIGETNERCGKEILLNYGVLDTLLSKVSSPYLIWSSSQPWNVVKWST